MDVPEVAAGLRRVLQAFEVGVHHQPVPLDGEDQRDVDRDALGDHGGDGGYTVLHRRDLDQQVRSVDDLPQLDGLGDGLVGIMGQPRVDFDGHPSVDPAGGFVGLG